MHRLDPVRAVQDNTRIVLVNTSHPGNIGSAARAMKNMGLAQLVLVQPKCDFPSPEATALAAGAADLLERAVVVDSLAEAVASCQLVIGTSARSRSLSWPHLDARACGQKVAREVHSGGAALVFGRERSGLTNDELQLCHYHVSIPTNPEYSSLNLAQAVQLLSYEIRMGALALEDAGAVAEELYPQADDLERFFVHLDETLRRSGFINVKHPGQVMAKLRRLFVRTRPEREELNILRGMLSSFGKSMTGRE